LGGWSFSGVSGTKTQPNWDTYNSTPDYYIVKLDSMGNMQWDRRYGGADADYLQKVIETADSGFILVGTSYSGASGDISQPQINYSGDFWIIKTDASGIKQWEKRYGGTGNDFPNSIVQNADHSYLVAGYTNSPAGIDVTEANRDVSNGTEDFWILKLDSAGNKLWDKRFGGTATEHLFNVTITPQHGYLLTGYSDSPVSGDKSDYCRGWEDFWVVKTDSAGNKIWDKTYGASEQDIADANSLSIDNGDFLVTGRSYSNMDQDKSQDSWGWSDYWILRIDAAGNKIWDKDIGGQYWEELSSVVQTADHGYLFSGDSYSGISGDKSEMNIGSEQSWIIKYDSAFNRQWDKTIVTDGHDETGIALETDDGCYVIANYSQAGNTTGYKTAPTNGFTDFWIIKFCPSSINNVVEADRMISVFPNPFHDHLFIKVDNEINGGRRLVQNTQGQKLYESQLNQKSLDLGFLSNGLYILKIETPAGSSYRKIIKSN
jgi:hypothetical protein